MNGVLASHYSRALADAVFAPNSGISPQDAVLQVESAAAAISESRDLQLALLSPAVPKSRKEAVVAALADRLGLHRLIRNFLLVVVNHRRTRELSDVCKNFELIVDEQLGWIPADIYSAKELDAGQREQIERALGTKLRKFIRAHYKVDPSLLGGVKAQVASREYDATLRGKLDGLRQRLAQPL